jgi:hypothetical protein
MGILLTNADENLSRRFRSRRERLRIAQGNPEQSEGAALGKRPEQTP